MASATADKAPTSKTKTTPTPASNPLADKARQIAAELRATLVEREVEVDLLMRSVIGRTNGLFIGEPGTAKSFGINSFIKHVDGAQLFELLLAKDTPSEQVLGPVHRQGRFAGGEDVLDPVGLWPVTGDQHVPRLRREGIERGPVGVARRPPDVGNDWVLAFAHLSGVQQTLVDLCQPPRIRHVATS